MSISSHPEGIRALEVGEDLQEGDEVYWDEFETWAPLTPKQIQVRCVVQAGHHYRGSCIRFTHREDGDKPDADIDY
jgi:hypothetical protein